MSTRTFKSIEDLTKLLPTDIIFLCGAGISLDYPTSLPTVNYFIKSLSTHCGMNEISLMELLKRFDKVNYRFESLIDEISKKYDGELIVANLFSSPTYNKVHYFLAKMLQYGSSIISTNFDNCIENALIQNNIPFDFENRIAYLGIDFTSSKDCLNGQLVKIHGSHPLIQGEKSEMVITISALAKTAKAFSMFPKWKEYLINLISNKVVVVMGYSCSDDFDVLPLLKTANPIGIVWLNYKHEPNFPVLEDNIDNNNISDLSKRQTLHYFCGQLLPLLRQWAEKKNFSLFEGETVELFTVKQYVEMLYPNAEDKVILCNEVLLSYGLYNEIIAIDYNYMSQLQYAKAMFRLGNYSEVIKSCQEVLETNTIVDINKEALYYLSSALYYEKAYVDSLEKAKQCCLLGLDSKDKIFYLNSMINYAGITYAYSSTLQDSEQEILLNNAIENYNAVLRVSKGVSIEAEANALWGLGDIERYKGNIDEATYLLEQSLSILKQIGNTYAIELLASTLAEINIKNQG